MRFPDQTIGVGWIIMAIMASPGWGADGLPDVSAEATRIHHAGLLIDGHNDLPWELRRRCGGDLTALDLSERCDAGHTDLPRLRTGGVKAQFWSVWIPTSQEAPARTVLEQIDLVHRLIERYPDDLELAGTAADIERIAAAGKIASLIGVEGGVAIENNLALLRTFYRLGARYMTLTHNESIDWADSATDTPRHQGLTPFGVEVIREMNRLGMLVDISHVSPAVMDQVLQVTTAPIIASHSGARAVCDHPRNVPDDILRRIKLNGGVVMVNFYTGFVNPEAASLAAQAKARCKEQYPDDREAYMNALGAWYDANPLPRATVAQVADHIDHIVATAGIDHVGIGGDFDGIDSTPIGLDDVACYPRLTQELVRRGYSEADIHKVLGQNFLRVLRGAEAIAAAGRPGDQIAP